MRAPTSARHALILKRVMDLAGASVLLVLSAPVLIACMLAIRARSPGLPIFRQLREGLGARPFVMYKLRTMYVDADARLERLLQADPGVRAEWLRYRRLRSDPRIVGALGRWLRRSSVDELPQLWNVLRGDMSLVGPRPLELEVTRKFPWDARLYRTSVPPGITGLWQVSGRSETDLATLWALDRGYVQTRSFPGDVAILLRTPAAVASRRGAY